jgi:hypothetical protein
VPTITFKVNSEEAARIRHLARKERSTVSEFLRRRALVDPVARRRARARYRVETSRVTGLPVMHGPADARPVTAEQVRALLADFP